MFRVPVQSRISLKKSKTRFHSSASSIRNSFIEYFVENQGHKVVKSSSVVPLCDPTVPFVNAGMNQFKGVFLGIVDPPCSRAVNSQKCVRVGGKHNDLEVVGTDGHHHTFFEMLGNWSFDDYYKKEACKMAWDLLLGPYRLKPENLVVTYFSGDAVMDLKEDRECRDIWKEIGVPQSRLKGSGAADNFWEMGETGPCGPCTEIHYVNPDGTLTEIWNLVFIQCNREADGSIKRLPQHHVDTGMGLERLAAILQNVPSNYDTDLFMPIIKAIEKNSKGVSTYSGKFGYEASLDSAYRRLADHARMISVCLADNVFPATSVHLKQIMRKSFKVTNDVFKNPKLLNFLYDQVSSTLGSAYPELISREKEAKFIIEHEQQSYRKMRKDLDKKWKDLEKRYPEVEVLSELEMPGFTTGYSEFKEVMAKNNSNIIPGELAFKLYDTYGFQEDIIEKIAELNKFQIDKDGFEKSLTNHKSRRKTAFKEQQSGNKSLLFDEAITKLLQNGVSSTNDQPKYHFTVIENKIKFKPLKTNLVAILNEDCEWIDFLEPSETRYYYLVAKETNFYCEEGGQTADIGLIKINENASFSVESVFKIRDLVFHKGRFNLRPSEKNYVNAKSDVVLEINTERRLDIMKNHTAVHLLNAAIRKVLANSVVCQIGSNVTDRGLSLTLAVYGEKLSQDVVLKTQSLVRNSIELDVPLQTKVTDMVQVSQQDSILTVPGETYPEVGLRLVTCEDASLQSRELCCGTHVPSTRFIEEFCITLVKGAGSHSPTVHALTGSAAKIARELFCRAEKMEHVIELTDPVRCKEEADSIREQLATLCGTSGAPYGDYANCLKLLDSLQKRAVHNADISLFAVAEKEVLEAASQAQSEGRIHIVQFVHCSYLMQAGTVGRALRHCTEQVKEPCLLVACAGGVINAVCRIPQMFVSEHFTAEKWMNCVAPVFKAQLLPPMAGQTLHNYAEMQPTKVSLITCEQLVQDAMQVAIEYAQAHADNSGLTSQQDGRHEDAPSENRSQN